MTTVTITCWRCGAATEVPVEPLAPGSLYSRHGGWIVSAEHQCKAGASPPTRGQEPTSDPEGGK